MLPFGHLGIGSFLVGPWARRLPKSALLVGTMLPDIIDKPLYYGLSWHTGLKGAAIGLISCSRTIGHTGLLLIAVTASAFWKRSKLLAALSLGIASHLFLDNLMDALKDHLHPEALLTGERSAMVAMLFPFYKARFSAAPFADIAEHAAASMSWTIAIFELVGAALLVQFLFQRRLRP